MRRVVPTLTVKQVSKLVGSGKLGTFAVSPRLYIQVGPKGASFLFRYVSPLSRKSRSMGLGPWNAKIGYGCLTAARAKASALGAKVSVGIDPLSEREQQRKDQDLEERARHARRTTFREVAERYLEAHGPSWSPGNLRQWRQCLRDFVYPRIGQEPISSVCRDDVLAILRPIWVSKHVTARRVLKRVASVIDAAKAGGQFNGDNPAQWSLLKTDLPKPSQIHRVRHFQQIPPETIPALMTRLSARTLVRSRALQFLLLTAARPSVVTGARWSEINLETAVWTVPAERMKARRQWRCPLSSAAVTLLRALRWGQPTGDILIFPGTRGHMSHEQLSKELSQIGSEGQPHGARTSFKLWSIRTGRDRLLTELQMAHAPGDATERAYMGEDDMLHERRPLMEAWGRHCTGESTSAVLPLRRAR